MLEAFPVVPLDANMTVGVAVVSYEGALTISLTADDLLCSDADVFAVGSSDRWHSSAWPRRSPAVDRRSDAFDCTRSALTDARRYRPCTANLPRQSAVTFVPPGTDRCPCPGTRPHPMIGT